MKAITEINNSGEDFYTTFRRAYFSEQQEHKNNLEQVNRLLKEQLALANQQQFGTSSEQQPAPSQDESTAAELPPAKGKKPKLLLVKNAGRKPLPEHLPRDSVLHQAQIERR
jgi:hypothetical protein